MVGVGTCNMACWTAKEDTCHCMCGGANHGIMRNGGEQPGRFCQRKGKAYELAAIEARWLEANKLRSQLSKDYNATHTLPWWTESAFMQTARGHILKWPEVQNFLAAGHREALLVWVRKEA